MTTDQQNKADEVLDDFKKYDGHVYWDLDIKPFMFKEYGYDENWDLQDVEGISIELETNESHRCHSINQKYYKKKKITLTEDINLYKSLKRLG